MQTDTAQKNHGADHRLDVTAFTLPTNAFSDLEAAVQAIGIADEYFIIRSWFIARGGKLAADPDNEIILMIRRSHALAPTLTLREIMAAMHHDACTFWKGRMKS